MAKKKAARGGRKTGKTAARGAKKALRRKKSQPSRKSAPKRGKVSRKQAKASARKRLAPKVAKKSKAARKKPAKTRRPAAKARVIRKAAKPVRKAARPAPARKAAKSAPVRKAPKAAPKQAAPQKAAKAPARKPLPRNAASAKANAEAAKKIPALNRERRRLAETDEELMPSAPSTLGYASGSSSARSGRDELRESLAQHTETGPALTGGDIDANWEDAYAVGDEAPGGDNPTPDQDRVDDIGKALGVQYEDNEELKGAEKIIERDRHRWELDPASSDDYIDRGKDED